MTDLIAGFFFLILSLSTIGFIFGMEKLKEQK